MAIFSHEAMLYSDDGLDTIKTCLTSRNIPQNNQAIDSEPAYLTVLWEEVERVVHSLKGGKLPGVDNVHAELLKKNVSKNVGMEGMAHRMDAVTNHIPPQKMKQRTVTELQIHKPYQLCIYLCDPHDRCWSGDG